MKNRFSHKLMAVLMTIVVFLSTMSVTLDMHYCEGNLVQTTVFHKGKGCGMEEKNPSSEGSLVFKKKCCEDKLTIIEAQNEIQQQLSNTSFQQQTFFVNINFDEINVFQGLVYFVPFYQQYRPPLVIKEIYKIDETYLI